MCILQNHLDRIYKNKARGTFIKSMRKSLQDGEKYSKYLFVWRK